MTSKRQTDLSAYTVRGRQLLMLKKLKLQPYRTRSGRTVSAMAQKAVLWIIDDYANDARSNPCLASQKTLAADLNCSERLIEGAIEALTAKELITNDRPRRWSTNHHRVQWPTVELCFWQQQTDDSGPDMVTGPPRHVDGSGADMVTEPSRQTDGSGPNMATERTRRDDGSAPDIVTNKPNRETKALNETATASLTDEWLVLRDELFFSWNIQEATAASQSARDAGWSVDGVRELLRHSHDVYPGKLCKWLQGDPGRPFGPEEAERYHRQRVEADQLAEEAARASAAEVRENMWKRAAEARKSGRTVTDRIIHAQVCRKLQANGLERFATDEETEWEAALTEHEQAVPCEPKENTAGPGASASTVDKVTEELVRDGAAQHIPRPKKPPLRASAAKRRAELQRQLAQVADNG